MRDWFNTAIGRCVLREEQRRAAELVPAIYYPSALQVGQPAADFLRGVEAGQRFLVIDRAHVGDGGDGALPRHPRSPLSGGGDGNVGDGGNTGDGGDAGDGEEREPPHRIIARPEALPFTAKAHNLIALPHALEHCAEPRTALREAAQTLAPQGCLVITGFNPLSLWSALSPFMRMAGRRARGGVSIRAGQVQDELRALGFDLVGATMLVYRPPLQNAERRDNLMWLEEAGARWWPGLGAVYLIVARKVNAALSRPAPARESRWRWMPGLAQPATRAALEFAAGEGDGDAVVTVDNTITTIADNTVTVTDTVADNITVNPPPRP